MKQKSNFIFLSSALNPNIDFRLLRLNAPFLLFEIHCMLTFYTLQNSGRTKQQFSLMTKCHENYFVASNREYFHAPCDTVTK